MEHAFPFLPDLIELVFERITESGGFQGTRSALGLLGAMLDTMDGTRPRPDRPSTPLTASLPATCWPQPAEGALGVPLGVSSWWIDTDGDADAVGGAGAGDLTAYPLR